MNYDHEKYPIILGEEYIYQKDIDDKNKLVYVTQETLSFLKVGSIGIFQSFDLDKNFFRIKIKNSNLFWEGNYREVVENWTLIKQ